MTIRNRLLFTLFPLIGSVILIAVLLLFHEWKEEVTLSFETKAKNLFQVKKAVIKPEIISLSEKSIEKPSSLYSMTSFQKSPTEPKGRKGALELEEMKFFPLTHVKADSEKKIFVDRIENIIDEEGEGDKKASSKESYLYLPQNFLLNTQKRLPQKDLHISYQKNEVDRKENLQIVSPFYGEKKLLGYLLAKVEISSMKEKIQDGLFYLITIGSTLLFFIFLSILAIANRITKPIKQLSNCALFIAAGDYGKRISIEGPKEIHELANTLNTMSESLFETINRHKENSLIKEKIYGEYESSLLLQKQMLTKVIEENGSDLISIKEISHFSSHPSGILLDIEETQEKVHIQLIEAIHKGFTGMYDLLTHYNYAKEKDKTLHEEFPISSIAISKDQKKIDFTSSPSNIFLWSTQERKMKVDDCTLEAGDYFFLFSRGTLQFFPSKEHLKNFIEKVFKYFGKDGLETSSYMLEKELRYILNKKRLVSDLHLLVFQRLY